MKRWGLTALLTLVPAAWGYFSLDPVHNNIHRTDFAGIQFLVNDAVAAGLTNADGNPWITADSDPLNAINAAMAVWNGVATSSARFAMPQTTSAGNNPNDRRNVIVFADNADTRSLLGSGVLALTMVVYTVPDGAVVDSDIVFNPLYTFSTTLAAGSIDLQSVLTHELGHSLGANHTSVLGAAMFQTTAFVDNHQSSLSSDDVAFVSALYPAKDGNGNGTLRGRATLDDGSPIHGGLVVALDPSTGVTVSTLSSLSDGSFEFQAPPGNYLLYVEPLIGSVRRGNLNIPSSSVVDTNFQSTFLGGNDNPSYLAISAGATVSADLQAMSGSASFSTPYLSTGMAGGSGDSGLFRQGPVSFSSGQVIDLLITGKGLDALEEQNLQILGTGIHIRPGSLRKDVMTMSGWPTYRVTLDVAPAGSVQLGTIILRKESSTATLTGVLAVSQPQIVDAGSFQGGAVAPGELATFFGSGVGPSPAVFAPVDADVAALFSIGGVSVTFDGIPAPVYYAGPNQVNFQVPAAIAGKTFTTMVTTYCGKTSGQFTIPVQQPTDNQ